MAEEQYDAIIVGGGFAGIYHLIHLREREFKCKLIEAGSDFGGTWYWNRYPGARVDSDIPIYEFSRPELWKGWTWTEKFPGWRELQAYVEQFGFGSSWDSHPGVDPIRYFAYVDKKLDLRKDCRFDATVKEALWDDHTHVWHVQSDGKDGVCKAKARYLIMCTVSQLLTHVSLCPQTHCFF